MNGAERHEMYPSCLQRPHTIRGPFYRGGTDRTLGYEGFLHLSHTES